MAKDQLKRGDCVEIRWIDSRMYPSTDQLIEKELEDGISKVRTVGIVAKADADFVSVALQEIDRGKEEKEYRQIISIPSCCVKKIRRL